MSKTMNELEKVMRFLGEEEYQGMLVVARLQSMRRQLPLSWIQIVTIYTIFWEDSDVAVVHAFNLASHENLVVSKDTNGPLEKRFFPEMGGGPKARSSPISFRKIRLSRWSLLFCKKAKASGIPNLKLQTEQQ